jgi:hypothetical protein
VASRAHFWRTRSLWCVRLPITGTDLTYVVCRMSYVAAVHLHFTFRNFLSQSLGISSGGPLGNEDSALAPPSTPREKIDLGKTRRQVVIGCGISKEVGVHLQDIGQQLTRRLAKHAIDLTVRGCLSPHAGRCREYTRTPKKPSSTTCPEIQIHSASVGLRSKPFNVSI